MRIRLDDKILMNVEKPARYTGGEWNMVVKDPENVDVRFAFCFPDVYEVGMSHLGMKILYHVLNKRSDTYCERVFAPWADMEKIMRERGIPLFALETKDPVKEFDIVGFTLQYEMCYTNVLNMLDLAGIPLLAEERGKNHPFVIAGGPCACNPEPLADFIDFFVIGEGEEVILEIIDAYKEWKNSGSGRTEFLRMAAKIPGVYVPSFYKVTYNEDNTISGIKPVYPGIPEKVRKRIIKDIDAVDFPEDIVVPFIGTVHDRIMLEMFRGCIRGCRFCQAGFIYRPVREKSPGVLLKQAKGSIEKTGYEEISLVSLSTSDYSCLADFTEELLKLTEERKINLSLPSLRIDNFTIDLMEKAQKVRKSGLTFAPEAGTQRLRDVINKGITEEDMENSLRIAFEGGWNNVKLYFMVGLPTETEEDIAGIADLAKKAVDIYYRIPKEKRAKGLNVTVSTSCFVPKPFTPFQWFGQNTVEEFHKKQMYLKDKLSKVSRAITYNWHDARVSFLEAVFARGDRRVGRVLLRAWRNGCRFDAWNEFFKYNAWMQAFEEEGIDPAFYANRTRDYGEILPWSHIDMGVSQKFLQRECEKAYKGIVTPNCRIQCTGCGSAVFGAGICKIVSAGGNTP
ncbi:TIGR03960 family B12-binding radical SAM protein [Thermoclostridium stercorarium]|uniref:TIGR03960 family B12-binding radical SAM protein n=1 Tax=Thermoclostridium stercorarium TaxID=1510 RepID=UPI0022499F6A|nr:TIGR03960 family B12-binding radical SAM protein [Thermoclostridium stercorarium]UZQ86118.1 TIGR03960 family B12-binding radical SAM protein [Thermoclostridium stercorarium]